MNYVGSLLKFSYPKEEGHGNIFKKNKTKDAKDHNKTREEILPPAFSRSSEENVKKKAGKSDEEKQNHKKEKDKHEITRHERLKPDKDKTIIEKEKPEKDKQTEPMIGTPRLPEEGGEPATEFEKVIGAELYRFPNQTTKLLWKKDKPKSAEKVDDSDEELPKNPEERMKRLEKDNAKLRNENTRLRLRVATKQVTIDALREELAVINEKIENDETSDKLDEADRDAETEKPALEILQMISKDHLIKGVLSDAEERLISRFFDMGVAKPSDNVAKLIEKSFIAALISITSDESRLKRLQPEAKALVTGDRKKATRGLKLALMNNRDTSMPDEWKKRPMRIKKNDLNKVPSMEILVLDDQDKAKLVYIGRKVVKKKNGKEKEKQPPIKIEIPTATETSGFHGVPISKEPGKSPPAPAQPFCSTPPPKGHKSTHPNNSKEAAVRSYYVTSFID
ncbi:unnamed protein product [Caenorhabditis auriculariae]|uniref:Uncharacterized protein n=1 Tax=Caenorhabditis auriculariae TaxID=2777116 RepID=A0A8S1HT42_9PELO|nr:unnamed protein product [Caenorhabditis auriculariae]